MFFEKECSRKFDGRYIPAVPMRSLVTGAQSCNPDASAAGANPLTRFLEAVTQDPLRTRHVRHRRRIRFARYERQCVQYIGIAYVIRL